MIREQYDSPTGVMNHLTPVENIVTNVKNFFGSQLSMVVAKAEDGYSIKCTSSFWNSEDEIRKTIYHPIWNNKTSLYDYVNGQGLSIIRIVPIGQDYIVYFCPNDIQQSLGYTTTMPCEEQRIYHLGDVEYNQISEGMWQPEQEIEDITRKDIRTLLSGTDKVKAAKAFAELLKKNMDLPETCYITAVRDEDGHESVALRYKYDVRKPFGKTATMTKTLVNIYGLGDNAIWVNDGDNMSSLSTDIKDTIDGILDFIGVQKTDDACCFCISEEPQSNINNTTDDTSDIDDETTSDIDAEPSSEPSSETTILYRNDGSVM